MSKLISFFAMILIIFSMFISFYGVVYASDIDMNLTSNEIFNQDEDTSNEITDENTITDENFVTDDGQLSSTEQVLPSTGASATTEEGLGFTNILNILLITVGVILILLSIAIIIRLK